MCANAVDSGRGGSARPGLGDRATSLVEWQWAAAGARRSRQVGRHARGEAPAVVLLTWRLT
jgi:hypothetical protein